MKSAVILVSFLLSIAAASIAMANHEPGHTSASALNSAQVKIVRHSFPVPTYPGAQWETSSNTWVTVPGAGTSITVPAGEQALIVVRFSPSVICSGTGTCESRIIIAGQQGEPAKPVFFNSSSENHWGVMYTERSLGPLGPGTYNVF